MESSYTIISGVSASASSIKTRIKTLHLYFNNCLKIVRVHLPLKQGLRLHIQNVDFAN